MYSFGYPKKVTTSKYMTTAIIYDYIIIFIAAIIFKNYMIIIVKQ